MMPADKDPHPARDEEVTSAPGLLGSIFPYCQSDSRRGGPAETHNENPEAAPSSAPPPGSWVMGG